MTEESALAPEAGPEDVTNAPDEAQTEGQTTEEETEGQAAEAEAKQDAEPEAEEKKSAAAKRRERDKARQDRLRREAEEAEQKAREAEQRLEKIRQAGNQGQEPKESEFQDYTDYQIAKALWTQERRQSERQSAEIQEQVEAAKRQAEAVQKAQRDYRQKAWQEQVTEAKSVYADFDQVAYSPEVTITPAMADIIQQADNGPDIAYHLGKNPSLAAQIAALSPIEAAMALGEIKATVKRPQPRTATQAPDPINPVKGSGGTAKKPEDMTHDEFNAWREAGGTF